MILDRSTSTDDFSSIMEESAKDNGFTTPIAYAAAGYYVKVAVSDSLGNITLSDPVTLFVTDSATHPTIVAEPKDTYRPRANGDYQLMSEQQWKFVALAKTRGLLKTKNLLLHHSASE
jgi:hypothetical protein